MPKIDEQFRNLERVPIPDLWPEIAERTPRPAPGPSLPRRLAVSALALAVAGAGTWLAARAFLGGRTSTPAAQAVNGKIAVSDEGAVFVVDPGTGDLNRLLEGRDPAWSPNGRLIAFRTGSDTQGLGGETTIAIANADGTNSRDIHTYEGDVGDGGGPPTWSPDGERIAVARYQGIFAVNLASGQVERVTSYEGDFACYDLQPDWSPDGTRMVFAVLCDGVDQGIWVANADGSGRRQLTGEGIPPDSFEEPYSDRYPVWSPDGGEIAFIRVHGEGEFVPDAGGYSPDLYVMNSDGTAVRSLTSEGIRQDRPAWSPDGTRIAFFDAEDRLVTISADGTDASPVSEAEGCCPSWQRVPTPEGIATP